MTLFSSELQLYFAFLVECGMRYKTVFCRFPYIGLYEKKRYIGPYGNVIAFILSLAHNYHIIHMEGPRIYKESCAYHETRAEKPTFFLKKSL